MFEKNIKKKRKLNIFTSNNVDITIDKIENNVIILNCQLKVNLLNCFKNKIKSFKIHMKNKNEASLINPRLDAGMVSAFNNYNKKQKRKLTSAIVNNQARIAIDSVKSTMVKKSRKLISTYDITSDYRKFDIKKSDISNGKAEIKVGSRVVYDFTTKLSNKETTNLQDNIISKDYFKNLNFLNIDPLSLYKASNIEQFPKMFGMLINKQTNILQKNINNNDKNDITIQLNNRSLGKQFIQILPIQKTVSNNKNYLVNIKIMIPSNIKGSNNLIVSATRKKDIEIDSLDFSLDIQSLLNYDQILKMHANITKLDVTQSGAIPYSSVAMQKNRFANKITYNFFRKSNDNNYIFSNTASFSKKYLKDNFTTSKQIQSTSKLNELNGLRATIKIGGVEFSNCCYENVNSIPNYSKMLHIPFYVKMDPNINSPVLFVDITKIHDYVYAIKPYKKRIKRNIKFEDRMSLTRSFENKSTGIILIDENKEKTAYMINDSNFNFDEQYEYYFEIFLRNGQKIKSTNTFIEQASKRENNIVLSSTSELLKKSQKRSTNASINILSTVKIDQDNMAKIFNEIEAISSKYFSTEIKEVRALIDNILFAKIEVIIPSSCEMYHVDYVKLKKIPLAQEGDSEQNNRMLSSNKIEDYIYELNYTDYKIGSYFDNSYNSSADIIYKVTPAILPVEYLLYNIKNNAQNQSGEYNFKSFNQNLFIKNSLNTKDKSNNIVSESFLKLVDVECRKNRIISTLQNTCGFNQIIEKNLLKGDSFYLTYSKQKSNRVNAFEEFNISNFTSSYKSQRIVNTNHNLISFKRCAIIINFNLISSNYDHFVVFTIVNNSVVIDAICHISKSRQTVFIEKIIPENFKGLPLYIAACSKEGNILTKNLGYVTFY